MSQIGTTDFTIIQNRFYDRIEKDEKFFDYYNVELSEAIMIAEKRSANYLIEALDHLSSIGNLQVDFSDYDASVREVNFEMTSREIKLVVEIMFLIYMKRDEALLRAMEINFTPSDLSVFSPANERTSYRNFIRELSDKVDIEIDNYKNRDRITGLLKQTINYAAYSEV